MSKNTTIQFETNLGSMTVVGGRDVITPTMFMRLKQAVWDSGLQLQSMQLVSAGSWGANNIPEEERRELIEVYHNLGKVEVIRRLRSKYCYSLIEASAVFDCILLLEGSKEREC